MSSLPFLKDSELIPDDLGVDEFMALLEDPSQFPNNADVISRIHSLAREVS